MQVITNLFEFELWSRAAEESTRNMPLPFFFLLDALFPFHFDFLVLLPRVTSWWRNH